MPSSRERSIEHIRSLLERAGFYVADTHAIRPTSFDLAARRDATLLLVKVLKNIDALDSEEATRLRELGQLFPAITLVIGQNSGASDLDPGVVYTRYGVPIINEETLKEFLEKALPPFLYASPGGTFAQVDGPRSATAAERAGTFSRHSREHRRGFPPSDPALRGKRRCRSARDRADREFPRRNRRAAHRPLRLVGPGP